MATNLNKLYKYMDKTLHVCTHDLLFNNYINLIR